MNLGVASSYTLSGTDSWEDPYLEEDKAYSSKQTPVLNKAQQIILRSKDKLTREQKIFSYLRKHGNQPEFSVIYAINDEQGDYIENILSPTSLKSTYEIVEDHEEGMRGVFALKYERKTAFTIQINKKSSEIPRWEPQIDINRRRWEDED